MEGRFDEARALLWQALAGDVPYVMPMARAYLASLFMKQDKLSAAAEMVEPLVREGDAEYRPFAMALLGRIRVVTGAYEEGRGLLERALAETVESGDEDAAAEIRDSLAVLSTTRPPATVPDPAPAPLSATDETAPRPSTGDLVPEAVDEQTEGPAAEVKLWLGEVASAQGEVEEAAWWFGEVIDGADPATRDLARLALATLRYEQGDLDTAADLARSPVTAHGEVSVRAAALLTEIADLRCFHLRAGGGPPTR